MALLQGASASASSTYSPSSSSSPPWRYQVFLSFRGEDTRNNFTAHLHQALDQKGINTYIDEKLERGKEISPALFEAIEGSKIAIIILSPHYASSTWCLKELTKILECQERKQQIILPVFYYVDPSDVKHQINTFFEDFAKDEVRFKDHKEINVQLWKDALTKVGNLSGFHLTKGRNESEFIKEIVQRVEESITHTSKYPVGIQHYVQRIRSIRMNDILGVGIHGTGGIGKILIAKVVSDVIVRGFEAIVNVRETSAEERGLVKPQETCDYSKSQALITKKDRESIRNTGGGRDISRRNKRGKGSNRNTGGGRDISRRNDGLVKLQNIYDHSGSQALITESGRGSSNNIGGGRHISREKGDLVKLQETYDHSGSQALMTKRGRGSSWNTGGGRNKSRENGGLVKLQETYDHNGSQALITESGRGSSNNTRGGRDISRGKGGLVKLQETYDHSRSQTLITKRGRGSSWNKGGGLEGHIKQNYPKYKAEIEKSSEALLKIDDSDVV